MRRTRLMLMACCVQRNFQLPSSTGLVIRPMIRVRSVPLARAIESSAAQWCVVALARNAAANHATWRSESSPCRRIFFAKNVLFHDVFDPLDSRWIVARMVHDPTLKEHS